MSRSTRLLHALFAIALLAIIPSGATLAGEGHSPRQEASPVTAAGWHVADTQEIEVLGVIVTLSPDGQWIAGVGPANQVCVWAVESLEPTCVAVNKQADLYAIAWSPDSTAIAWTNPTNTFTDSDLYVMEVPDGIVTNLTDDQSDGHVDFKGEPSDPGMMVDLAPAWTGDSQSIVFSRVEWGASGASTAFYSISRAGGDPRFIHRPEVDGVWSITFPMRVLSDGAILYGVTASGNDAYNGIWHLPPGGEPRLVMPGANDDEFPAPIVVDVLETPERTIISGSSHPFAHGRIGSGTVAFQLDLATGEVTPAAPGASPATFSPNGGATLHLEPSAAVVVSSAGARSDLGYLGSSQLAFVRGIDWATNNTFLLALDGSPTIIVTLAI